MIKTRNNFSKTFKTYFKENKAKIILTILKFYAKKNFLKMKIFFVTKVSIFKY